ncbi:flagellar hook-basal body complex protein [Clostridium aestuarii]|uniref:Flagellar hook-basal body complex protein n=1 Tax=Clostridium aestuarii TaxID=338193 RepID=A0ABT4CXH6_9CLOT|nr:flagellar hook-basal body complex protein [Clostridium aestuarii]MCY6483703.1 flagellar hook-basal body complex protein [Clostridium aestuarii]
MIRGIYTAVSGLITQEARQDVISNNLANANTVGFKSDNLIAKKFDDVLLENYDKEINGKNVKNTLGKLSMGSEIDETFTNYGQGVVENTNRDTDFAINGSGFFAVSRENGFNKENYYTRNGHFHINNAGYLVNDQGDKVLAKNIETNNIEPIYVGKGKINCNESGEISIDKSIAYKLYIANFKDNNSLEKVSENLYKGENPLQSNSKIRQYALEKSNVNVMNEMTNMMMTLRMFESNQKAVQSIDASLEKTVNEVGKV